MQPRQGWCLKSWVSQWRKQEIRQVSVFVQKAAIFEKIVALFEKIDATFEKPVALLV